MKYIVFLFFLISAFTNMKAQNSKGVVLKGYIITIMGNDILFMPTNHKDSFINIVNEKSFGLGTAQNRGDDFRDFLKNIGDSINVNVLSGCDEHYLYDTTLYYFYCEIGLKITLNNKADFEINDNPFYCLMYDNRKFGLGSIWLRNRLVYLKADNDVINQQIRENYRRKGYTLPEFINW